MGEGQVSGQHDIDGYDEAVMEAASGDGDLTEDEKGIREGLLRWADERAEANLRLAGELICCTALTCDPELYDMRSRLRDHIRGRISERECVLIERMQQFPSDGCIPDEIMRPLAACVGERVRVDKLLQFPLGLDESYEPSLSERARVVWKRIRPTAKDGIDSTLSIDVLRELVSEVTDPESAEYWKSVMKWAAIDLFNGTVTANAVGWSSGFLYFLSKGGWDMAVAYLFAETTATFTPLPGLPNAARYALFSLSGISAAVRRHRRETGTASVKDIWGISKIAARNVIVGLPTLADMGYLLIPALSVARNADIDIPRDVVKSLLTRGLRVKLLLNKYEYNNILDDVAVRYRQDGLIE